MDESWRLRMGMPTPKLPNYPPRRSTGNTTANDDPLNPEDFTDVFGGPPRTILSRQFSSAGGGSGSLPRSSSSSSSTGFSYEDIFRKTEKAAPEADGGRKLPQFRIPSSGRQPDGFYGDIFGWDNHHRNSNSNSNSNNNNIDHVQDSAVMKRSRSRSKASSSSALSSEELSPLRPAVSEEWYDDVYLFGSKLRPINVNTKWNSDRMLHEEHRKPLVESNTNIRDISNISEIDFFGDTKNYLFGSSRKNSSPESISIDPLMSSCMSFKRSVDDNDLKYNSPSSPVSSVCQSDREAKIGEIEDEELLDDDDDDDDDDDESMSSYVIEFDIGNKECASREEPNGVDEAIAWAKEKFQAYSSQEIKPKQDMGNEFQISRGQIGNFQRVNDKKNEWAPDEQPSKVEIEMQLLDEKIRLWSTGKEADIRMLMSSLHHILWPNSGWAETPLMSILESPQVKKSYMKAQLCLHPDKLQQRGATFMQKYVAEKVFSVLQDAWAAFISHDAVCMRL